MTASLIQPASSTKHSADNLLKRFASSFHSSCLFVFISLLRVLALGWTHFTGLWSVIDALLVLIKRTLMAAVVKFKLLGMGCKHTDFMIHSWLRSKNNVMKIRLYD